MPCPLPRRTRRVRASVASPSARPSPLLRRVGIRDAPYKACSGFTHVTAYRIARSPKATFVTRLRPGGLPLRTARQLPAQPTTRWVEPSSTGKPRPPGARKTPGKGYASGMGASGILLKTLTSFRVRTPPSGELPGVLPLLRFGGGSQRRHSVAQTCSVLQPSNDVEAAFDGWVASDAG